MAVSAALNLSIAPNTGLLLTHGSLVAVSDRLRRQLQDLLLPVLSPDVEHPTCLPQGQFLCLAIRDGKLVLYYDFNTGLEMAKPSSNSSSISSATNKAVRGEWVSTLGVALHPESGALFWGKV